MLKREDAIEKLKEAIENLESIYPFDDFTPYSSEGPDCELRSDNKALKGLREVLDFLES